MKAARLLASLLILFACVGSVWAQFDVPKIEFQKWQLLDENEDYSQYIAKFPSAFDSGYPQNDTVQLEIQLPAHVDHPPVVLILHYWGAPNLKVERSLALELNDRGIGAAIMTLPYHLTRTPKGATSGAMAIQSDPEKLKAVMTQSVMDVRRSLDFLQQEPECGRILGIYGTSLGAVVSTLAYAVDDRITNSAFLLGGIELGKIIWRSSLLTKVRDELRAKGYNEERLDQALRPIEPSTYLKPGKVGNTFVVRAKYDTVIPPECTDALIRALPNSKVLEIDSGHYGGIFVEERLLREVANFFNAMAKDREYMPPLSIVTPTVRVGFMMEAPAEFNIAAGFDLLKFDPKGRTYASVLLTPKNPVIWVGSDISGGLNAGVGISNRRAGFGLFWSIVL
ncbi:MAG: hypothetical protein GC165_19655 [Armatimonadetes bacterium]|nr:hypothetical protein [Armatimonadota bacterium]